MGGVVVWPRLLRGRARGGDAKPKRRSRLRKQSAQALLDRLEAVRRAFLYRMPFANGGGLRSQAEALHKERIHCFW